MENLLVNQNVPAKAISFLHETVKFAGNLRDEHYHSLSLSDLMEWQMSDKQQNELGIHLTASGCSEALSMICGCSQNFCKLLSMNDSVRHDFQVVVHLLLFQGFYCEHIDRVLNLYLDVYGEAPHFHPRRMKNSLKNAHFLQWLTANIWRYTSEDNDFNFKLSAVLKELNDFTSKAATCHPSHRRIYDNLCRLCRNYTENRFCASLFAVFLAILNVSLIEKNGGDWLDYVLLFALEAALMLYVWRDDDL